MAWHSVVMTVSQLAAANASGTLDTVVEWIEHVFHTIWVASTTPVPTLDSRGMVICLVVATAGVVTPMWSLTRNVITMAHEGGHALIAVLTGRRLQAIQLHADTSGVTQSSGRGSGMGLVLTIFAGYVSPSLWGLGSAALVSHGYATGALWLLVVLLVLMLLRIRNGYGLLAVSTALILVIVVSWWGDALLRILSGYTLTWFLLMGSIRAIIELQLQRFSGNAVNSDADQLADDTRIPGIVWVLVWLGIAVASWWYATQWMGSAMGGIPAMMQWVL